MLSTSTPKHAIGGVASSAGHTAHIKAVPRFSPNSHEFWPSHPGAPRCNCLDPHPRCTSTKAARHYSPALRRGRIANSRALRWSLDRNSQHVRQRQPERPISFESVVSSVWRRHRRMDPRALCLRSKGLTMLQALQPAIPCANIHGHLLAPMQAPAGERVGAQWASNAKGATDQENCSSILPARRRTGPTTILTSWPSFVTSSSSLASLTPRN